MKNISLRTKLLLIVLVVLLFILFYQEIRYEKNQEQIEESGSLATQKVLGSDQPNQETFISEEQKNAPCGSHFGSEGICAGVCDKGTCVSEKNSCYCKVR